MDVKIKNVRNETICFPTHTRKANPTKIIKIAPKWDKNKKTEHKPDYS